MQINKFKQFLFFAIICSITSSINAQISILGEPRSFSEKLSNLQKVPIVSMPDFDLNSLLAEDSIRESLGLKSARFAKSFNVDIDIKSKGLKEMLKDSSNIWRLCVKSSLNPQGKIPII